MRTALARLFARLAVRLGSRGGVPLPLPLAVPSSVGAGWVECQCGADGCDTWAVVRVDLPAGSVSYLLRPDVAESLGRELVRVAARLQEGYPGGLR
jgi:hypothetical protein